jgi:hypothetical protein
MNTLFKVGECFAGFQAYKAMLIRFVDVKWHGFSHIKTHFKFLWV